MSNVNLLALQKQAIGSPEVLLDHALPLIVTGLDAVISAEAFRLTRGGLVVWHVENSTRESGSFIPVAKGSLQEEAIQKQVLVTDTDARTVYVPLVSNQESFGLLALAYETALDNEVVEDLADDLSLMLYAQQMNGLLRQQINVTGELSIASSLEEITTIIAKAITQKQQFISMNVFSYDEAGAVTGGNVIATANRNQSFQQNLNLEINLSALKELHRLLIENGEVHTGDVETDERFTEDAKNWLKAQKIKSIIIAPLWIEGHLHAFIALSDTQRSLALTTLEKELFQNIAHQASISIEKQRLLEQTRDSALRSDEQVQVLRRINELIARTNDEDSHTLILQNMANILLEVTGVDHVGVVMRDAERAYIISEAPDQGLVGNDIETGENSLHYILNETKKPIIVPDIASNTIVPKSTKDILLASNTQAVVIVPMFDETNTLIGSVGLDYYNKQSSIDPAIVDIAQTIVTQITLSLQKIRLLAEAQQKATQLEQLTEFGQALRAYLTIPRILSTTLEYCPRVINADYVAVLLYDRASNSLQQNASFLHGDNNISVQAKPLTEEDNSIALTAWSSHELVKVDNLQADWEWKHKLNRELQSIVAIPLSLAGVTQGVLEVGSAEANHFNQTDVTTLRQISNQLAIALSNATAYAQSQHLARNKIQANDIVSKLQEQVDVNDILATTVQELGKVLGARRARIRLGSPASEGDSKR